MSRFITEDTASDANPPPSTKKILVSFVTYDQDNFNVKTQDSTFIGSFKDEQTCALNTASDDIRENRLRIWRPAVALAQLRYDKGLDSGHYEELIFDKYYLLGNTTGKYKELVNQVVEDIKAVKPNETTLEVIDTSEIKNPWDTGAVYNFIMNAMQRWEGEEENKNAEFYFNCTSGTTVMRNCLFLITQTGPFNALRIAPTPWENHKKREYRTPAGSYTIENPQDLWNSYSDYKEKNKKIPDTLQEGIQTEDKNLIATLEKLAHLIGCIQNMNQKQKFSHPILLTGETGVGKTILAANIKKTLGLEEGKFISINCATIGGGDPNLTRSTLFGHERGAYSGADTAHKGALEEANGGVLFLDEIGELDLQTQAALLKAIEERKFIPLGGSPSKPRESSFQLVCGTNRDLDKLVAEGRFRADLLNRINMWHFTIPPLRKRKGDIELNCESRLETVCSGYNKTLSYEKGALGSLKKYAREAPWTGNFREFNAMLTRLVVLSLTKESDKIIIITNEAVKAEIEYDKNRRKRTSQEPTVTPERACAETAPAEKPDFPHLTEILGEAAKKIPVADRPWLDFIAGECSKHAFKTQKELSRHLFGEGGNKESTISRQLAKAGLKFRDGNIVSARKAP